MFKSNGRLRPGALARGLCYGAASAALTLSAATAALAGDKVPLFTKTAPQLIKNPKYLPQAVSKAPRNYILQLADDPVTVVDAAAGQTLSTEAKSQLQSRLVDSQRSVEQQVVALGGNVLAHYQLAYNGVKVRIPAAQAAALANIPGVISVHPVHVYKPVNVHGVPLIGDPTVWGGAPGYRGEGIKIADIDTGIDYTHADFGGPGTAAAYQAALATDTADPDPTMVGPGAPKVKGGTDLVGDSYNADPTSSSYQPIPHPDNNPLDCNSHGTHTAGTLAGFGVLADGSTYTGFYAKNTVSANSWMIGPGVAPKAELYAVRVFGCAGSTDVVTDAIEWSVAHHMDAINMSLGATFGEADDPDAVAASNASKDGVIVVAAAGNEGQNPYMVGSPAVGDYVLSAAAEDPTAKFPAAKLALSTGTNLAAQDSNGAGLPSNALPVKVLYLAGKPHTAANISLGCDPSEYTSAGVAGDIVIVKRGVCARVARAIYGQQAGAAAVLMVNTDNTLPPYEGQINSNPDTGEAYTVTIPFLGIRMNQGGNMVADDGGNMTMTATTLPNPSYLALASFTSGGPRGGDGRLKPEVTAPGVSIASAGMGTGNQALVDSGTSMATPMTCGTAALVRQAHRNWGKPQYWQAAIVNTADPDQVTGYVTRVAGAGLVQAAQATMTDVVALADGGKQSLAYGIAKLSTNYAGTHQIKLLNFGSTAASFSVATSHDSGVPHSVKLMPTTVTLPPRGSATVSVELDVPAATAGDASGYNDAAGLVEFTPIGTDNNGVSLRVPYYMVPHGASGVVTALDNHVLVKTGSATATTTNAAGAIPGNADWYSWGLYGGTAKPGLSSDDLNSVGVQTFPGYGIMAFSILTNRPWSTPSVNEFDILVDVNRDGTDDYDVFALDYGQLTTGTPSGQVAVGVLDLRTGSISVDFYADAPFNSRTMVLPVLMSQLCNSGSPCLSAGNPRFNYHVQSFGLTDGTADEIVGPAAFNAFSPSLSTGMYDTVAVGGTATETVNFDSAEWALTPSRGLMIVTHDNQGPHEAQVIPVVK